MSDVFLENVQKSYDGFVAVQDFSLEIRQGELITLLGPSGCGKTTILRLIAGFVLADRGRIRFGDRDMSFVPPQHRNTGIVFQGYALFPHMTVAQNVAFGLEMRGIPRPEIERLTREALAMVRLERFAERLPRQLSGGQQQRVALARAIVIKPAVLLLDEPLSALDAKLRQEVREEILRLQKTTGLTTIFVTHDQEEALSLADRIVVMNHGRIEQIGTPRDVYERSRTSFVASFIGKSNFLKGRFHEGNFITEFGARIVVTPEDAKRHGASVVAVRPEQIAVSASKGDVRTENQLSGVVRTVEYLGSVVSIGVEVADGVRMNAAVTGSAMRGLTFAPGDTVHLSWPADATLAFSDG